MKKYQEIQHRTERSAVGIALTLTVLFHVALYVLIAFNGLTYMYPPPPEQSFVIDFSEEDEKPVVHQQKKGSAPQSEEPDRTKPVKLTQRSEAQELGKKENLAREATGDDFGDVEKYEPPREKPIDNKALFHAANNKTNKDTLAAQTAAKVTDALKEGHAQGNTKTGRTTGTPNAHLQGRNVVGVIAKPAYPVQESGKVIVTIWVDNYGNVKKALAGAPGTDVNDAALWNAARDAAMKTHFNVSADAPALQKGTITYIFKLKDK